MSFYCLGTYDTILSFYHFSYVQPLNILSPPNVRVGVLLYCYDIWTVDMTLICCTRIAERGTQLLRWEWDCFQCSLAAVTAKWSRMGVFVKYLRNVLHENDLLACRLQWTLEERLPNFVWIERFLGLIGLRLVLFAYFKAENLKWWMFHENSVIFLYINLLAYVYPLAQRWVSGAATTGSISTTPSLPTERRCRGGQGRPWC